METLETLQRCWSEPWKKAAIVEIVEQQKETLDLQLDLTAGEQERPQDDAQDGTQEENAAVEPGSAICDSENITTVSVEESVHMSCIMRYFNSSVSGSEESWTPAI